MIADSIISINLIFPSDIIHKHYALVILAVVFLLLTVLSKVFFRSSLVFYLLLSLKKE